MLLVSYYIRNESLGISETPTYYDGKRILLHYTEPY